MIDRADFDRYSAAVDEADRLARARVVAIVNGYRRWKGSIAADVLEGAVMAAMLEVRDLYGDAAMQAAIEFYMATRSKASPLWQFVADLAPRISDETISDDVRDLLNDQRMTAETMAARMSRHVQRSAERQMRRMAARDKAATVWALVPEAGACGWCRMIASRGFVYTSKANAEATRHANCRCKVVADFDTSNPALRGYDPDALREDYADAADAARGELGNGIGVEYNRALRSATTALMDEGRDHNDPTYYWRVTKPKRDAEKAAQQS